MAADEKTTWGEVCTKVGFRDNLYRVCRDKVPSFQPAGFSAPEFDDAGEVEEDFTKRLRKSAQPIPPPPPADWKYEPEGFMEHLVYGNTGKYILYGSLAAAFFWFFVKPRLGTLIALINTKKAPPAKNVSAPATVPKAA